MLRGGDSQKGAALAGIASARWFAASVLAIAAILGACWASPPVAAGEEPPALQVVYEGSFNNEYETDIPSEGGEGYGDVSFNWSATGLLSSSAGKLQPLTFTQITGERDSENPTGTCHAGDHWIDTGAASIARSPVAEDWAVEEIGEYPSPGWQYEVSDTAFVVPLLWTTRQFVGTACEEEFTEEPHIQVNELPEGYEAGCPVNAEEEQQLLASFDVTPGAGASQRREYHQKCEGTFPQGGTWHNRITIVLMATATSPSANNAIPPSTPTSTPPASSPPAAPSTVSQARRKQLKEQAGADLQPALEEAVAVHGLLDAASGVGYGVGLSVVAKQLVQTGSQLQGNDTIVRVVNDFRIEQDPPDPEYETLAPVAAVKPKALRACHGLHRKAKRYCEKLRAVETSLLARSGETAAIDEAMYTTISRDTAAIDAGDYAAAEAQVSHFEALHSQFESALAGQGSDGEKLAALLREAHVKGTLTKAKSALAIKWLEGQLTKHAVTTAELRPLAGSTLTPKPVNIFNVLTHPAS
jgi:hypothetical protein